MQAQTIYEPMILIASLNCSVRQGLGTAGFLNDKYKSALYVSDLHFLKVDEAGEILCTHELQGGIPIAKRPVYGEVRVKAFQWRLYCRNSVVISHAEVRQSPFP